MVLSSGGMKPASLTNKQLTAALPIDLQLGDGLFVRQRQQIPCSQCKACSTVGPKE